MKKLSMFIVMAIMVEFLFVGISRAAEPNMPKRPMFDPNMIRGRVIVEKNAEGVITSVKLENRRQGTWNIVLDEKGKELGEKMADKIVAVKGIESTKDGEKWLTVEKYTEMRRPQRPHRPGDPNSPPPGRGKDKEGK